MTRKSSNNHHDLQLIKKNCRCCNGSGMEYDNDAVGRELRALRELSGLSLSQVGARMKRKYSVAYLSDLELGHRKWNDDLIEDYRRICA